MVRTKKQVVDSLAKNKVKDQQTADYCHDADSITTNARSKVSVVPADFCAPMTPPSPIPNSISKEKAAGLPMLHRSLLPLLPDSANHRLPPDMIWCSPAAIAASPFASTLSYKKMLDSKEKLQSLFTNLSALEITEMLIDCGYNEDEVILRLITQSNYIESIRFRVDQQQSQPAHTDRPQPILSLPYINEQTQIKTIPDSLKVAPAPKTSDNTQQQHKLFVRKQIKRHTEVSKSVPLPEKVQVKAKLPVLKNAEPIVQETKPKPQANSKQPQELPKGRLLLDDALKQIEDSKRNKKMDAFAGWSQARIRAFEMMDKNPNSYYYRFNAPGEQQSKGKWTEEETKLFMDRLKELGANQQWGIFSMTIPGRVGYQCSNYYRQMIQAGQIKDPNYVLENGKARYLFETKTKDGQVEKLFRKHSKHGSIPVTDEVLQKVGKQTSLTKSHKRYKSDDESEDATFKLNASKKKKTKPKEHAQKRTANSRKQYVLPPSITPRITRQRCQKE